ncbi:MAG TPA: hypothetical protein VL098_02060 [Flavipsychrobacter sp.]|nr:hypothetical protein [Flavipsychrobacter sp.]
MKKIVMSLTVLVFASQIGFAQNFKAQQRSQEKLIKTAYKKGRITEREYYKLIREQDIIAETIDKYYADGYLDVSEKNRLHDKLERSEKRLRRYKRNGEVY